MSEKATLELGKKKESFLKTTDPARILVVNILFIMATGVVFTVIQFLTGQITAGIILIAIASIVPAILFAFRSRISVETAEMTVALWELFVVLTPSSLTGTMDLMFPLVLAANIIAGAYFNRRIVVIQAAIAIFTMTLCYFAFNETSYGGLPLLDFVKMMIGVALGIVCNTLLVTWGRNFIERAETKEKETAEHLKAEELQAEENKRIYSEQAEVLHRIKEVSMNVDALTKEMLSVSDKLMDGANTQQSDIVELTSALSEVNDQLVRTTDVSEKASSLMRGATNELEHGNDKMNEMLNAMGNIEDTSRKINSVMKAIDDIAFQTNILALNAAVEAARAGEAGKGFAVVAGEVRNLSARSASAAKETAAMLDEMTASIAMGSRIAKETAAAIKSVANDIMGNAENVEHVSQMANEGLSALNNFASGIDRISQIANNNTGVAEENTEVMRRVSNEADNMRVIINKAQK